MRKHNFCTDICNHIKTLQKLYPSRNLGSHLDVALAEYDSIWGLSDKEFSFALEKYIFSLENDPIASEAEVDRIIREASNLDSILDEEEDDDY